MLCLALALPGARPSPTRASSVPSVRTWSASPSNRRGDVEIVTGATPGVVVEADDEEALETVELRVSPTGA
jgi:hypothetical protein